MSEGYLIIAVRSDEQHVLAVGVHEQKLQEALRGGIDPLKIVEKNHERVSRRSEDVHEVLERDLEAVPRLIGRERGRLGLRAEDELELRNEVDDQPPVLSKRLEEIDLPFGELCRGLGQYLQNKLAEGVDDGR